MIVLHRGNGIKKIRPAGSRQSRQKYKERRIIMDIIEQLRSLAETWEEIGQIFISKVEIASDENIKGWYEGAGDTYLYIAGKIKRLLNGRER